MTIARVSILTSQQKTARGAHAVLVSDRPLTAELINVLENLPDYPVIVINDGIPEISAPTVIAPTIAQGEPSLSPSAIRKQKEERKRRRAQQVRTHIQARPCSNGRRNYSQRSRGFR